MTSSKIPRICKRCGTPFEIWPYQDRAGQGNFCSLVCERATRRKRITLTCENCGNSFEVIQSAIKWHNPRWCSRKCFDEGRLTPLKIRFQRYVGPTTESGCVLWIGGYDTGGYGTINSGPPENKPLSAPRLVLEWAGYVIPDGQGALHRCDNPPCIFLGHLFIGTMADNMRDKQEKGRTPHGENHCRAVLTEAMVLDAKQRYDRGDGTYKDLAPDYGVSPITLGDAIAGRTWKHLS